jgi:hypothetical protein
MPRGGDAASRMSGEPRRRRRLGRARGLVLEIAGGIVLKRRDENVHPGRKSFAIVSDSVKIWL